MKVYITKYALTQGIQEKEADQSTTFKDMIIVSEKYRITFCKPFWHETKDEALAHANKMKANKIESLKKQIKKLENLNF